MTIKITFSELVFVIAGNTKVSLKATRKVLHELAHVVHHVTLLEGNSVSLPKLGVFKRATSKSRRIKVFGGSDLDIPSRTKVRFEPSKFQKIKNSAASTEEE